jgi:hypothetical protein
VHPQQPEQQPHYRPGPPFPPPPPAKRPFGWTVPIVVIILIALAAGGLATYVLVHKDSNEGGPGLGGAAPGQAGAPGRPGVAASCTGMCVGGSPYVNACNTFGPEDATALLGDLGTDVAVREIYADALPPKETSKSRYTGYDSECIISVQDPKRPIQSAGLTIRQLSDPSQVDQVLKSATQGGPSAPFGPDPSVTKNRLGSLVWRRGNAALTFGVSLKGGSFPDAQYANALKLINDRFDHPNGKPRPRLAPETFAGAKVAEACQAFGGPDYEKITGYATDAIEVERGYQLIGTNAVTSTCKRNSAVEQDDVPAPPGTAYLSGSLTPEIELIYDAKAQDAQRDFESKKRALNLADLPGLGVPAFYGIYNGRAELGFLKGQTEFTLAVGGSVGTKDWPESQYRDIMTKIAGTVLARM